MAQQPSNNDGVPERVPDSNWLASALTGLAYVWAIPLFFLAIRVVQEYERGVIFRLGRLVRF